MDLAGSIEAGYYAVGSGGGRIESSEDSEIAGIESYSADADDDCIGARGRYWYCGEGEILKEDRRVEGFGGIDLVDVIGLTCCGGGRHHAVALWVI
jgi:hypothetical protein